MGFVSLLSGRSYLLVDNGTSPEPYMVIFDVPRPRVALNSWVSWIQISQEDSLDDGSYIGVRQRELQAA